MTSKCSNMEEMVKTNKMLFNQLSQRMNSYEKDVELCRSDMRK